MKLQIDLTQGKKVVNVFFTSDFHLFHHNVLKFDKRPFSDVYAMHDYIEKKWNETVTEDDIVIYLGDLSFAKAHERQSVNDFVSRLNGKIHFVIGNHDKYEDIVRMKKFESVQDYLELKITHFETKGVGSEMLVKTDTSFSLMHYPIYSWNKKHHGNYMVHGHCHGNLHHGEEADFYVNRRVIDVGCMLHDYTPISYSEVINKLSHVVLEHLPKR
jgi:calcineurin-like phosphoesterase family protein